MKEIYENVGELSLSGLYYLPKIISDKIVKEIKSDQWKFQKEQTIIKILKNETDFFLIDTDFDYHGGERDGEIYRIEVVFGNKIDNEIKLILNKIEPKIINNKKNKS